MLASQFALEVGGVDLLVFVRGQCLAPAGWHALHVSLKRYVWARLRTPSRSVDERGRRPLDLLSSRPLARQSGCYSRIAADRPRDVQHAHGELERISATLGRHHTGHVAE